MKVSNYQQRLNELFDSLPLLDYEIAERLGVSKQSISNWRAGFRSPKKTVIERIAKQFDVDVSWIMGYDEQQPKPIRQISEQDMELLNAYHNAPQVIQQAVCAVLNVKRPKLGKQSI